MDSNAFWKSVTYRPTLGQFREGPDKKTKVAKIAKNTQIKRCADYVLQSGLSTSEITQKKTDHSIAFCSKFCIGMVYTAKHILNPHVETD